LFRPPTGEKGTAIDRDVALWSLPLAASERPMRSVFSGVRRWPVRCAHRHRCDERAGGGASNLPL